MRIKSILLLLVCFLLSGLTMPAIACPPPYCGSCCHWVSTGPGPSDGYCDLDSGAECGDCQGGCYNPCNNCVSCSCEWDCSPTQSCCNGNCCEEGQICCPDETCHDECQNTPPTGHCDTSHSEENKCQYCVPLGVGLSCLDFKTMVYTGNTNHSCSGGCSGDCEEKPDVHCYTEYNCIVKDTLTDWACVVFGSGELGCVGPDMFIFCPRCKKDPQDQGQKSYVIHQACK